jgi:hypothetical protein
MSLQHSEVVQRRQWHVRSVRFDLVRDTKTYELSTAGLSQEEMAQHHTISLDEAAWRIWSQIEDGRED